MKTDVYKEYAETKQLIKGLEARLKELNPLILQEVLQADKKTVENEYGRFYSQTKKSWSYSETVDELKEELEMRKVKEQENGTAEVEEVETLYFKTNE